MFSFTKNSNLNRIGLKYGWKNYYNFFKILNKINPVDLKFYVCLQQYFRYFDTHINNINVVNTYFFKKQLSLLIKRRSLTSKLKFYFSKSKARYHWRPLLAWRFYFINLVKKHYKLNFETKKQWLTPKDCLVLKCYQLKSFFLKHTTQKIKLQKDKKKKYKFRHKITILFVQKSTYGPRVLGNISSGNFTTTTNFFKFITAYKPYITPKLHCYYATLSTHVMRARDTYLGFRFYIWYTPNDYELVKKRFLPICLLHTFEPVFKNKKNNKNSIQTLKINLGPYRTSTKNIIKRSAYILENFLRKQLSLKNFLWHEDKINMVLKTKVHTLVTKLGRKFCRTKLFMKSRRQRLTKIKLKRLKNRLLSRFFCIFKPKKLAVNFYKYTKKRWYTKKKLFCGIIKRKLVMRQPNGIFYSILKKIQRKPKSTLINNELRTFYTRWRVWNLINSNLVKNKNTTILLKMLLVTCLILPVDYTSLRLRLIKKEIVRRAQKLALEKTKYKWKPETLIYRHHVTNLFYTNQTKLRQTRHNFLYLLMSDIFLDQTLRLFRPKKLKKRPIRKFITLLRTRIYGPRHKFFIAYKNLPNEVVNFFYQKKTKKFQYTKLVSKYKSQKAKKLTKISKKNKPKNKIKNRIVNQKKTRLSPNRCFVLYYKKQSKKKKSRLKKTKFRRLYLALSPMFRKKQFKLLWSQKIKKVSKTKRELFIFRKKYKNLKQFINKDKHLFKNSNLHHMWFSWVVENLLYTNFGFRSQVKIIDADQFLNNRNVLDKTREWAPDYRKAWRLGHKKFIFSLANFRFYYDPGLVVSDVVDEFRFNKKHWNIITTTREMISNFVLPGLQTYRLFLRGKINNVDRARSYIHNEMHTNVPLLQTNKQVIQAGNAVTAKTGVFGFQFWFYYEMSDEQ